jgi:hypothetical protein
METVNLFSRGAVKILVDFPTINFPFDQFIDTGVDMSNQLRYQQIIS